MNDNIHNPHMYVSIVAAGGAIVHEENEDGECLLIIMSISDYDSDFQYYRPPDS